MGVSSRGEHRGVNVGLNKREQNHEQSNTNQSIKVAKRKHELNYYGNENKAKTSMNRTCARVKDLSEHDLTSDTTDQEANQKHRTRPQSINLQYIKRAESKV